MSAPSGLADEDFEELPEDWTGPVRIPTQAPGIHRQWFNGLSVSSNAWYNDPPESLPRLMDEFAYMEPLRLFYEQVQREPDDRAAHLQHPEVPKHCHECRRYYAYSGTLPVKIEITVGSAWLAEGIFTRGAHAYLCTECFFKIGGRIDANSMPTIQGCEWFRPICLYRFAPPWRDDEEQLSRRQTSPTNLNTL